MVIYRRKASPLKVTDTIDYKDVELLSKFLSEQGKILPRRLTGLTTKQQTKITKAIKRARILSLLPFVNKEN
jgi:small subunit ribosomal protein S18|uniref:Small ribosomal subunit protein bS18c n=2 Tax=Chroomonas TaxID=3028 RepID=A0A222AI86_9CRYP|nr:ribosomal protein S18 [Chroomonas placoidea]ASO76085.1 ribosomal protein S18 [Chroomonas placoidea]ASV47627.1 ribosomal protein S18 [Chroomonas mesostigmatica CCMP1168]